jgi:uncharacterized protein
MVVRENVQVVKDAYAAFGRGDIQGLLAFFAEDIEWIIPGEWPLAGTYRGRAGVAVMFQRVSELLEISFLETHEFVAQTDRVLVICFSGGRVKNTNRRYEHHEVLAFTVRNGKVTNVREYIDTQALARGFEIAANVAA